MLGWRSVELGLLESGRRLGRLLGLAIGNLSLLYSVRRIDDDITDLEVARAQLIGHGDNSGAGAAERPS